MMASSEFERRLAAALGEALERAEASKSPADNLRVAVLALAQSELTALQIILWLLPMLSEASREKVAEIAARVEPSANETQTPENP